MDHKTYTNYLLSLLTFLIFIPSVMSQNDGFDPKKKISQYSINYYSREEGLPIKGVLAVTQTPDGYLWFATYSGLVRFDGVTMKVFNTSNTEAFENDAISTFFCDTDSSLWAGSYGGLLWYKNHKWSNYTQIDGLPNDVIRKIFRDSKGILWIGTTEGLCQMRGKNFVYDQIPTELKNANIKDILEDSNGKIWFASTIKGLFVLDGSKCRAKKLVNDNEAIEIRSICHDNENNIWVGTSLGLFRIDSTETVTQFGTKDGLPVDEIYSVFIDKHKVLWIGSSKGLSKFVNGSFTSFIGSKEFDDHYVTDIMEDREGNIWVTSYNYGAYSLKNGKFTSYTKNEGLSAELVNCILELPDSSLLIGTNNGLFRFTKDTFLPYNVILPSQTIRDLMLDSSGRLWICTTRGLVCKKDNEVRTFTDKDGLSNNYVRTVCEDKNHILWFGTENGLNKYVDGKFESTYRRDGLSNDYILSIFADHDNKLWIGTVDGLNMIDNKGVANFSVDDGLTSNTIFKFFEDVDNTLWIGTNSGMTRYKDGVFSKITINNGLPSINIFQILPDAEDNFWISSSDGVYRVARQELNDCADGKKNKVEVILFNYSDGIMETQCVANSRNCITRDGRMWFSTLKGVTCVAPYGIKINNIEPINLIEYVLVDSSVIYPNEPIVVEASTRRLLIKFTGLSLTAPEKVKLKYMLEGFDHDWIEADGRREAYYTNLPPGDYVFKMISCNNDGIWNEAPATLKIQKKPLFRQTVWFYLILFLSFVALASLFYFVRVRRIKARNKELEKLVLIRTAEIENKKEEIRAQAEQLVETNKELEKLSVVASETDNAVIITSSSGELEWVNSSFERIYGYNMDEFKELVGSNILETSSNPKIKEVIQSCIDKKSSVVYESSSLTRYGKSIWVQTTLNTIIDGDGNITKIIAIDSDITKTKEAEEEIRKQNSEILKRNEEIKQQKEEIEAQSEELEQANSVLAKRNKQIMDSIVYAERIQKSLLPDREFIKQLLPDHFVFFRPRDIVSGDFYWLKKVGEKILIVVADCTGHGVPGAFMSIIGHNLLEQITALQTVSSAASILDLMRELLDLKFLTGNMGQKIDDGIDMSLCILDIKNMKMEYAGAMRELLLIRDKELIEFKGDSFPIGKAMKATTNSFNNHLIDVKKGDIFYLFSDGYMDQFGGPSGHKYYSANFKKLLREIHKEKMEDQYSILDETIKRWMYGLKQLDDMLILGFKL